MTAPGAATARAHANIALVKYWGKRDAKLNLPAAGSLSLTLAALTTTTRVEFLANLARDELVLAGRAAPEPAQKRLESWLELVRDLSGERRSARVVSDSNFPTASGLASSASAYAALAVAATAAAGVTLPAAKLSELARRGSGSAARSIFGGFVEMLPGTRPDGADAVAVPVVQDAELDSWPVRMVVAVVGGGAPKAHPSRDAMAHTASTSPLYAGWLASVPDDLAAARAAVRSRDLARLGDIAERSALTMHASAMAARPGILYFQPATIACIDAVRALRAGGVAAHFTIDAGPHVKVLTDAASAAAVADRLREIGGVSDVIVSAPGGPAHVVEP